MDEYVPSRGVGAEGRRTRRARCCGVHAAVAGGSCRTTWSRHRRRPRPTGRTSAEATLEGLNAASRKGNHRTLDAVDGSRAIEIRPADKGRAR